MELSILQEQIIALVNTSELNYIREEDAIAPEYAGVRFFDEPLIAIADAADPYFTGLFKEPQVIGPHFREPELWLEGAKSVISFFLPFTKAVCDSNRPAVDVPYDEAITNQRCSALWLHGRVEGQHFIDVLSAEICAFLEEQGYHAVAPSISPEFTTVNFFSSNWSERHVAYAAGLGTFGLSKGLITEKGMAGRIGSVITNAVFPPTARKYSDPFAYCTMCGACQRHCPAGAIDVTKGCALGKDQRICGLYVKGSFLPPQGPNGVVRYGCGKCQVGVPCEHSIPGVRK